MRVATEGRYKVRYPDSTAFFAWFNSWPDAEAFVISIASHEEGIRYEVVDAKEGKVIFQYEPNPVKHFNDDPEVSPGLDRLALLVDGDPVELASDLGPYSPSFVNAHTLERDCE